MLIMLIRGYQKDALRDSLWIHLVHKLDPGSRCWWWCWWWRWWPWFPANSHHDKILPWWDVDDDDNLANAAIAASRSPWSGSSFSPPSTLYIIMITLNITLHIISLNITNMIVIVVKIIIIKIILKNHLRHQPIILKLYTVQSKTRPS